MAQKRFGPTLGAGVVVLEKEAERILEAAPLGVTAYLGVLEKGPADELISCYSKAQFTRKCGGRLDGTTLPDCCQDFWDHSGGNGELYLVRITDGLERKAIAQLWSRETMGECDAATDGVPGEKVPVGTISAHNGGRWGGRELVIIGEWTSISTNTITTALDLKVNELAGASFHSVYLPTKVYTVVSNTAGPNTVITLKSNENIEVDYSTGDDEGFMIVTARDTDKEVMVRVGDGENNPGTEFSLDIYIDGLFMKRYSDLNMDEDAEHYFVNVINDDSDNWEIEAASLVAGGQTTPPEKRPATHFGTNDGVAATVLTIRPLQWRRSIGCDGDETPIITLGTLTQAMKYPDQLKVVVGAVSAYTVYSMVLGKEVQVGTGTIDSGSVTYDAAWTILPPFAITEGAGATAEADEFLLDWHPLEPNDLKAGTLYPDYGNQPGKHFYISSNTISTITIASGDLTTVSDPGDLWLAVSPIPLKAGYDGDAPTVPGDYVSALAPDVCYLNKLKTLNKGLVKLGAPGQTDTSIVAAAVNYVELKNWQFRVEIPNNVVSEGDAVEHINTTIGRNDYLVTAFPSYGKVNDPDKSGQLKTIPLTGMIHGREALFANRYSGYHKAAAGIDFVLSRVVQLAVEDLNDEVLNPQGINPVKFIQGNCIVWGDRTCAGDPAWKWKHQRELMSHYECRLAEGFDWIVFAINDVKAQHQLTTTLRAFFLPEFQIGAVRGASFGDAVTIKVDNEINTDVTRAVGELYAEISLRLADTVERFIMRVGKMGIFDDVSA